MYKITNIPCNNIPCTCNFRASGEIVASSLANGGPPPCFMDEKAFKNLVHLEMNALDRDAENCVTATEKEIIDNVKSDVNLHRDSVLEHGYTQVQLMQHTWMI